LEDPFRPPLQAPNSTPFGNTQFFDHASLELDLDREVILLLVKMFISDTSTIIGRIREAVRDCDSERTRTLLHMLKGCCRSVNAVPVERFCEQLEDAAAASDWVQLNAGLERLEPMYKQLSEEVQAYCKQRA
jgi:HPt (histidine-containing phosphotransfer) domain-containing protein